MHNESVFIQALVYLAAAVISVPLAKRFGLGSVLGYLLAGIVIGPYALGLVGEKNQDIMHFAEFGVVLMLFVVGLELRPSLLWKLKGPILGTGGMQVLGTAAIVTGLALVFSPLIWQEALAVGLTLALSSTAIVLQTLSEKGLMKTDAGQQSFAVLLFQDIAVIPMLALMPLLATHSLHGHGDGEHHSTSWIAEWPAWGQAFATLAAIAFVVLAGRFLMGHAFRFIARTNLREIFTAAALLLVVGIALLMTKVGLSPALGTFLAGVVLAESEYRHELESDIEPFKGLLLGLFFIAVGSSIDFALIFGKPALILGLVAALIALKFAVLMIIGRVFRMGLDQNLLFSVALAQGGEFCFVLLSFSASQGVLTEEISKPLVAVVAVSMALTPLLFILYEKVLQPNVGTKAVEDRPADEMDEEAPVIMAGFGRFGNVTGRFLRSCKVDVTVLEHDSDHVELLRSLGLAVFYGDASRVDLLHAAGADKAKLYIIALDDEDKSLEIVHTCQKHFPHLELLVRACSRMHAYRLIEAGVDRIFLEQQASSLDCAVEALRLLGNRSHTARRMAAKFKRHDLANVFAMAPHFRDRKALRRTAREGLADLNARMDADHRELEDIDDAAWDDTSVREDTIE